MSNSSWIKLTTKQKDRLCRIDIKDEIESKRDKSLLQNIIDKYNLNDYAPFSPSSPVNFVLTHGTYRAQRSNPYNGKRFVENYLIENPKLLKYPLIDHAEYFRNTDKKAFLISHTYLSPEEVSATIDKIRLIKGYDELKFCIEEASFYSPKALCVVIWM